MREFSGNPNVVFGDVNLQDAGNIPGKFGAGQGGWPTVRYFNAETGYDGAPYKQKTSKSMCDELGHKWRPVSRGDNRLGSFTNHQRVKLTLSFISNCISTSVVWLRSRVTLLAGSFGAAQVCVVTNTSIR